ncbi:hypothetical protein Ddye_012281, partial [Dipteronia dyeriana]
PWRGFFWGDGVETNKIYLVKWETLCQRKAKGGLGIGSVSTKNKGLLAKWVWHFGVEEASLRKRMLCTKYGIPLNSLKWNWDGSPWSSDFIKAVGGLFRSRSKTTKILEDGLRVIVGR